MDKGWEEEDHIVSCESLVTETALTAGLKWGRRFVGSTFASGVVMAIV